MICYLYGVYEDLNDSICFLISRGFIIYESKKHVNGKNYDKLYYLTLYGVKRIEDDIIKDFSKNLTCAKWYVDKCKIIKEYFGDMSGTELKIRQYRHDEYASTKINDYIQDITDKVRK
ncbi:hypothetical protein BBF96_03600 [Anoxybacter fermentans]|uniref:Uncharacterized protein n=1 Tax=Anoxybacter fermentans TaxID=1323375 RepID=A0A3Q9HPE5_9FIRM|nr:hypothetical protein [Anoxybacter fermentans]AZR72547.1 hypothetical protein BBF96_03600 [Anoxybacter fermentans]